MDVAGYLSLKKLSINKQLFIGFGLGIAASLVLGLIAWRSLSGIGANVGIVAQKAKSVNTEMVAVAENTKQAAADTNRLRASVENKLLPATKSSVQDMISLEEVFDEIVESFTELMEEEDMDVEDFKIEADDILETIKRESLPLVRSIRGNTQGGAKMMVGMSGELKALDQKLTSFVSNAENASKESSIIMAVANSAKSNAASTVRMTVMILAGIVVLLVTFSIVISRAISLPITRIIETLTESSTQVSSASSQISSSSQALAEGATEQASSLEETSASLEEISSMTKQNADHANSANSLMDDSKRMVDQGVQSMKEMIQAMDSIKDSSGEISKIIKVIEEIAFQTNLLALNAAVEAARAGEHGKGFAVVAEEVRNLAQRSATASKDTASLIENAVKKADEGSEIVSQSAKALDAIADSTKKVGDLVGEIAAASNEQSNGIEQVNQAVNQMDQVTQRNAASAEETASASEELSAQSESLNEIVIDLSGIIYGASNAESADFNRPAIHQATKAVSHQPALPIPQRAHRGAKTVAPEEIIPLDDENF